MIWWKNWRRERFSKGSRSFPPTFLALVLCFPALLTSPVETAGQVETIEGGGGRTIWVSHATIEGHLEIRPGATAPFSLDERTAAVVGNEKIVLFDLRQKTIQRILKPSLEGLRSLSLLSADFVDDRHLLVRARGKIDAGGKNERFTPELMFLWNTIRDELKGPIKQLTEKQNLGAGFFIPSMGYFIRYSKAGFDIWSPSRDQAMKIDVPTLTRRPDLIGFSPNGHWLLAARFTGSSQTDVVVIRLSNRQMVAALRRHTGMPRCVGFSPDNTRAVTAGDGKVIRIWKVADWSPEAVLEGHTGSVNWVEFSPDGKLLVSGSEDKTVRLWSVETGENLQTISEHKAPVKAVAFSPKGRYLATSTEKVVKIYRKVMLSR